MDVPDIALDLFTRFVNGESFADIPLPPEGIKCSMLLYRSYLEYSFMYILQQ